MYLSDILAAVPETVEATAETTLSIGERVSKGLGTSLHHDEADECRFREKR